eukprot:10509009-Lingulodinium_polyedra.AAC.1
MHGLRCLGLVASVTNQCCRCRTVFASREGTQRHLELSLAKGYCTAEKSFTLKALELPADLRCPLCEFEGCGLEELQEHIVLHLPPLFVLEEGGAGRRKREPRQEADGAGGPQLVEQARKRWRREGSQAGKGSGRGREGRGKGRGKGRAGRAGDGLGQPGAVKRCRASSAHRGQLRHVPAARRSRRDQGMPGRGEGVLRRGTEVAGAEGGQGRQRRGDQGKDGEAGQPSREGGAGGALEDLRGREASAGRQGEAEGMVVDAVRRRGGEGCERDTGVEVSQAAEDQREGEQEEKASSSVCKIDLQHQEPGGGGACGKGFGGAWRPKE